MNNQVSIDHPELLKILRQYVAGFSTQRAAAQSLGISFQYLGDLLRERAPIPERVALQLGWKQKTEWIPVALVAAEG